MPTPTISQSPAWRFAIARMRKGKDSAAAIARDLGVSRERVRQVRTALGIPKPPTAVELVIQKAKHELGRRPDVDIARKLGVGEHAVRDARSVEGMPAFSRDWPHRTLQRYRRGCRCTECRAANNAHQRKYIELRRKRESKK